MEFIVPMEIFALDWEANHFKPSTMSREGLKRWNKMQNAKILVYFNR